MKFVKAPKHAIDDTETSGPDPKKQNDGWCPYQTSDKCQAYDSGRHGVRDVITTECIKREEDVFQASDNLCYERNGLIQWYNAYKNQGYIPRFPLTNGNFTQNDKDRLGIIDVGVDVDDDDDDDAVVDGGGNTTFINISRQDRSEFPRNRVRATTRNIDMSGNRFETIPIELFQLESIHVIYASGNNISQLPGPLVGSTLMRLELSFNNFEAFPNEILNLHYLSHLEMHHNYIKSIPETFFSQLQNIKIVDFSFNLIHTFPDFIVSDTLSELYMNSNSVSNRIHIECPNLKVVNFSHNALTDAPIIDFGINHDDKYLEWYDCSHNRINQLVGEHFKTCSHIINFDFSHNSLNRLPEIFSSVTFEKINLESNKLIEFPNEIREPGWVEELRLSHNNLISLPHCLTEMINLCVLKVSQNNIAQLPNDIERLTKLSVLDVSYNEHLNVTILRRMTNLRELSIVATNSGNMTVRLV